jgi:DNA ligase-1
MLLAEIVDTSARVAATRSRNDKIAALAALLDGRPTEVLRIIVPWLAGEMRQGRIGVGYAQLSDLAGTPASESAGLTVERADAAFTAIREIAGAGSARRRREALVELFGAATAAEQRFLTALLAGELRQGALEGVLGEAVGRAARVPGGSVRRAAMLSGNLVAAALAALEGGEEALAAFHLELFRPVQPMLAQTAQSVGDAIQLLGPARLDAKLDGARVQVHRKGDRVEVWTRQLLPVGPVVPEVVESVLALPVDEIVLDGEVLALRPDGRPHPFQTTMRRFGRKLDLGRMRAELPLVPAFFDVLHVDGRTLLDEPLSVRAALLDDLVPPEHRVLSTEVESAEAADAFLSRVLDAGHEGVMAKSPAAPYEAGNRGSSWLKIKPVFTLDLVVLAAEWGSGRRRGWLSNLHLGARDPSAPGAFVMLGKTFKGLTDATLTWQTEQLLRREVRRDAWTVYVRPELVVEIAFNEVQASPRYPGGMALRFARVKGYRIDKGPEAADTIDTVRAIFRGELSAGRR